jgi:hypothetical protein
LALLDTAVVVAAEAGEAARAAFDHVVAAARATGLCTRDRISAS